MSQLLLSSKYTIDEAEKRTIAIISTVASGTKLPTDGAREINTIVIDGSQ